MPAKPQITRVAAYGLLCQTQKILLCRVSEREAIDTGFWTLPGGGIDFGEAPVDAMVREVYEETGLSVRPNKLAGIDSFYLEEETRSFHGIRIIYYADIVGGTLRNEIDGSTDLCAWWSQEQAQRLDLVDLAELGLNYAFPND